jgi:hypothetical protein
VDRRGGPREGAAGHGSRGIWETAQLLAGYLREHIHTETPEEELTRRGAEGAARRLVAIVRDPGRDEEVRRRIGSLLGRWARRSGRDQEKKSPKQQVCKERRSSPRIKSRDQVPGRLLIASGGQLIA